MITTLTGRWRATIFPARRLKSNIGRNCAATRVDSTTATAHRIEAATEVGNVAEQRALEKAGFTREGVLRGSGWRSRGRTAGLLRDPGDQRPGRDGRCATGRTRCLPAAFRRGPGRSQ